MRSFIRFRDRSSVDLPQPDGPIKAVISLWPNDQVDTGHRPEVTVVDVHVGALDHPVRGVGQLVVAGVVPARSGPRHVVRAER